MALLLRDMQLATRSGGGAALALGFFALVATLVPLGIGADLALLARVAGGVLWVGAVLAALLSLDRLFQGDYDDGSLELIALAPLPLELTGFAKIAAHWLSTGLPLIVLPLLSPAVIFGAGAVAAQLDGFSPSGALGLLGAFSLAAVLLSPFAAAASVRLNLSG